MKKRNTIIRARMGYINQDDTVTMMDIKTGEKQTYKNKAELNHLTELQLGVMTAKKAS